MVTTLSPERAAGLRETILDPVRFSRAICGHRIWSKQVQILQAIATKRRVAIKGCHASGKTFVVADAVLWWPTRYADGMCITTGPSWEQVRRDLWGNVHHTLQTSAGAKVTYPPALQTELRFGPHRFATGLSTNQGVRFQGPHGRILIVIDEAPGLGPDIYEAIEGIRAGGDVRIVMMGNPTIASGPFYDAFTSQRDSWETITIGALDTPNFDGLALAEVVERDQGDPFLDANPWPELITRRYVWEKWREWGPEHPLWQGRVMGVFPTQAEDALISLAWLEAARNRPIVDDGGPITAGLDVAGPGDAETVLVLRSGSVILGQHAWAHPEPRGEIVAALLPWRPRLQAVNVDSVGIGYYLARHLQDQEFPVVDVNVGRTATDAERYVNRKAELYWGLRLRCQQGDLAGLTDEKAIGQLAGIRYQHNARGQVVIEGKEAARKRGVASPDRAEAIMLAFATPVGASSFRPEDIAATFREEVTAWQL